MLINNSSVTIYAGVPFFLRPLDELLPPKPKQPEPAVSRYDIIDAFLRDAGEKLQLGNLEAAKAAMTKVDRKELEKGKPQKDFVGLLTRYDSLDSKIRKAERDREAQAEWEAHPLRDKKKLVDYLKLIERDSRASGTALKDEYLVGHYNIPAWEGCTIWSVGDSVESALVESEVVFVIHEVPDAIERFFAKESQGTAARLAHVKHYTTHALAEKAILEAIRAALTASGAKNISRIPNEAAYSYDRHTGPARCQLSWVGWNTESVPVVLFYYNKKRKGPM